MNILKTLFILVLANVSAISAVAQNSAHSHDKHLARLLDHYLAVKNALTLDDLETAKAHLVQLKTEVTGNDEMVHHEAHAQMHAKHHKSMTDAVNRAYSAADISDLRLAFNNITDNLKMALVNQEYDTQKLFIQYCPMANDGKGGHWISKQEKIANPYMGQKMPTCGVTKETINAGS